MATKSTIRIEFDKSMNLGIAELTDSQTRNYGRQSQRLRTDLTYVIMPQWVHSEKLATPINGRDKSNRIYAIGVDADGNAVQAISLSVNTLQARHFGLVKDNPALKISAIKNEDGLWRVGRGADQFSVFEVGSLPLTVVGKKAYISRPFAFKVTGRGNCYTISFTEKGAGSGKYDVDHYNEDGNEFVTLGASAMNKYVEVLNVPSVDWNGVIGDDYTKDLPK